MLKYLRLTRAHTAPLEVVPAILGAALAEGTIWSLSVALWGVAGLMYHLAGYGHNSVQDWLNGYDVDDPHKQHHPLNRGTISPRKASLLVNLLVLATVIYVFYLAASSIGAIAVLFIGFLTGVAYNVIGKLTILKFILISVAHTTVFMTPYLALNGDPVSAVFMLGILYMFLWVSFQISVSGELKDITQIESNFLKDLGSYMVRRSLDGYQYRVEISAYSKHYAYSIKTLNLIAGFAIAVLLDSPVIVYILLTAGTLAIVHLMIKLLRSGVWRRQQRVRQMSMIEMITAIFFVVSLWSVIGEVNVLILVSASLTWGIFANRLLWGTVLGPRV